MWRFALASLLLLLLADRAAADGKFCANAHYLAYETPARAMGEVDVYVVVPDASGVARRARVRVPGSVGEVVGLRCRAATLDVLTRDKLFVYNVNGHHRLAPKLAHRADVERAVSFRPGSGYFEGYLSASNDRVFHGDPKVTIVLPWKAGKADYSVVITQRQRRNGCGNHIVAKLVRTAGSKSRSLVLRSYDDVDECCSE
jgi:hypothetical protein